MDLGFDPKNSAYTCKKSSRRFRAYHYNFNHKNHVFFLFCFFDFLIPYNIPENLKGRY